ncbi:hypothetical protein BX666DRAFT_1894353 [Dichotomocladium elegans]|nr:hypothetical protein BX666DRAFT_1894353 [Dichotomocladium elegans]
MVKTILVLNALCAINQLHARQSVRALSTSSFRPNCPSSHFLVDGMGKLKTAFAVASLMRLLSKGVVGFRFYLWRCYQYDPCQHFIFLK